MANKQMRLYETLIQSLPFSLLFHVEKSCLLSLLTTLSHPYVASFITAIELLLPNYVPNLTIIAELRYQFYYRYQIAK